MKGLQAGLTPGAELPSRPMAAFSFVALMIILINFQLHRWYIHTFILKNHNTISLQLIKINEK